MAKTTSIALSKHHTDFIAQQIATGRYETVSEVVREALRLLEKKELELEEVRQKLSASHLLGAAS